MTKDEYFTSLDLMKNTSRKRCLKKVLLHGIDILSWLDAEMPQLLFSGAVSR